MKCPVREAAGRWPDLRAIVRGKRHYSFSAWDARAASMAGALAARGIRPGHCVALVLEPSAEMLFLLGALFRRGAVACILDPRWPDAALAQAIERMGCGAVIRQADLEALGDAHSGASHEAALDDDAPATMLLTSGSSGEPKIAVHTLGNHVACADASNRNIPVEPGDCWLMSLSLHHVAGTGVLFRCLRAGAAIAVPERGEDLAQALRRYRVTHVSLVATQLRRLLRKDEAGSALGSLKAILLGGSAMPGPLIDEAVGRGLRLHVSYGLTEMASQVATTAPGDPLDRLRHSSGKPLAEGTVAVAPDGEILVRGPALFAGYWTEGRIERPTHTGGWFPTGDLGRLDEEGYLVVSGRKDSMFVSGGENICPEEIERHLLDVPGVLRAVVVPRDDAEFGQAAVAYLQCEDKLDGAALKAQLRQVLPVYKVPREFLPWPQEWDAEGVKIRRVMPK